MTETKRGPWTIHSSRIVYENPWMNVAEHRVTRPDGKPGLYGVMEPKNLAIGILPVFENGDTLLVGQYRFALDAYSWELPEGGGPMENDPMDSAKRELAEETGYRAAHWQHFGQCDLSNSLTNERGDVFLAWDLSEGDISRDGSEADMVTRRTHLSEVLMMILDGEIKDAFTHIIVHRAIAMARTGRLDPRISKLIVDATNP